MANYLLPTGDPPVDLDLCLQSGQVFLWHREPGGSWIGSCGDLWARFSPDGEGALRVESPAGLDSWSAFFQLGHSIGELQRRIEKREPRFFRNLESLKGLRILRQTDPVETVFCFLCTSNNHLARISKMACFLRQLGSPFAEPNPFSLHRFPSIERLCELTEDELRDAGFGYRAATIPLVAKQIFQAGGISWLRDLQGSDYRLAWKELQELPGVGPKLADCICLYALHHGSATPVDTHLFQAYCKRYRRDWVGTALTKAKYEAIGNDLRDRFDELAGYVQFLLYFGNQLGCLASEYDTILK